MGSNEGIIVSGSGSVHGEQIAVGKGATACKILTAECNAALEQKGLGEIRDRIAALEEAVKIHSTALGEQQPEIVKASENVAAELAKDEPSKLTVLGTLNFLAQAVTSVTGVATAVEALKKSVEAFL